MAESQGEVGSPQTPWFSADEPRRARSARRKYKRAKVTLLQTTLRSSHIEKIGKRMRLPVSGHWAVEIRGEAWVWDLSSRSIAQTEGSLPGLIGERFASAYLSVLQRMINVFALRPQAGSRAQINSCSYGEYLAEREKWTEPLLLGTTDAGQKRIRKSILRRNEVVMFYSIFSNNCQHFILDLCESIALRPSGTSKAEGVEFSSGLDTEFARDFWPNEGDTRSGSL
ncbi:Uu.00g065290.m01.CDS01 [Anthostomella pinea]|uniref:Uu.00g065290.m01.CDS01 n=1 Tax=Anthostomella pinea TaxID=933095 RepID=A0AAI8VUH5_9PEZI|nr:Uu.00g065290.m01.CDS01 [Anthostomella pinea]